MTADRYVPNASISYHQLFSSRFWKMAAVVDDKPFGGVGLEVKEEA
ncbi:MAG: hypothetical protein BSOLF_0955 [Candidatus Carbobacillus altaicus]|uniref:Uncharacterized protein n=1 Tax=Candidatus Carbonibacillus altaicus TaxID=2163959 RepID=A0A2R6XXA5_9BACL|nr:MAG: hypothetical protein BSOLF_0955 [Candidatus Carbobacillus altaicus]